MQREGNDSCDQSKSDSGGKTDLPKYFPYLCREDAIVEYNALRAEILESQKQRVATLKVSLAILGGLFAFFVQDKSLPTIGVPVLALGTLPLSLLAFSTRIRERRLGDFIGVMMPQLSVWERFPLAEEPLPSVLERSSSEIVIMALFLDAILFGVPLSKIIFFGDSSNLTIIGAAFALFGIVVNSVIYQNIKTLPRFKDVYEKRRESYAKNRQDRRSSQKS